MLYENTDAYEILCSRGLSTRFFCNSVMRSYLFDYQLVTRFWFCNEGDHFGYNFCNVCNWPEKRIFFITKITTFL